MNHLRRLVLFLASFIILYSSFFIHPAYAIYDPLSSPNNRVGIHIISPSDDELNPAREMVNKNGDWGYVTFLIEKNDRKVDKWQTFFNKLRESHLIPIVRLASEPDPEGFWKRPTENDAADWANFLDQLNWPTKNRYIVIYNEPNHAKEWGNSVDAPSYAKILDQTITALKDKNPDFFVLNAGLDASAPQKLPNYQDQHTFMQEMEKTIPGIFNKLDGWTSHSYPNPAFVGKPTDTGRGTIRTYLWELQVLQSLGITKKLPIFITETGWKHSEGIKFDPSLPIPDKVAEYYKYAFENVWNSSLIITITPFLLNYQESPFDHFSFKKITGKGQDKKILGIEYPEYYPQYDILANLPKTFGLPIQNLKTEISKGGIFSSIVTEETYQIHLTFKNTGQSIWNDRDIVRLIPSAGSKELGISPISVPKDKKIKPGEEYTFLVNLKAPNHGKFKIILNLFEGTKQFDNPPFEFDTEVKSPVILKVKSTLKWKDDFAGKYILNIAGTINQVFNILVGGDGTSEPIEARHLIPDIEYDFTLQRPFYQSKTIHQKLVSGENTLDFGELQPDIPSAILNPKALWNLLPFSN